MKALPVIAAIARSPLSGAHRSRSHTISAFCGACGHGSPVIVRKTFSELRRSCGNAIPSLATIRDRGHPWRRCDRCRLYACLDEEKDCHVTQNETYRFSHLKNNQVPSREVDDRIHPVEWQSHTSADEFPPRREGKQELDHGVTSTSSQLRRTVRRLDEARVSGTSEGMLTIEQWKERVHQFMSQPSIELLDGWFVLVSCLLVAISTLPDLNPFEAQVIRLYQDGIAVLFATDFFARWFASKQPRGKHFSQPLVLVDVVVVILPLLFSMGPVKAMSADVSDWWMPGWITSSGSLINLRLLRILRLQRVLQDLDTFSKFEMALGIPSSQTKDWQLQLARVVLSIFTLLSVSTGLIYTVEHGVNPDISDYFTALYFGLTTLTTVGFGDITPVTWQGKLVVSLSMLAGVAVIPAQGAALVEALLARQNDKKNRSNEELTTSSLTASSYREGPNQDNFEIIRASSDDSVIGSSANVDLGTEPDLQESARPIKNERMVLETAFPCPTCGSMMHWSNARYCWSCGSPLPSIRD